MTDTAGDTRTETDRRLRRWPLHVLLVVLAFGVVAGSLMTWHHEAQLYGDGGELLGCSETASVSCDEVSTSAWSEVLGVPLATWAVATYVTFGILVVVTLRGKRGPGTLLFIGGAAVTSFSLFLLYVALSQIGFLCSWCLRLYVVNALTLVLAWIGIGPSRPDPRSALRAAALFTVVALFAISVQRLFDASS